MSRDAVALLCKYRYPGNVRELKHIIQSGFYSARGAVIGIEHLPAEVVNRGVVDSSPAAEINARELYARIVTGSATFDESMKRPFLRRHIGVPVFREVLHQALTEAKGSYRKALRLLRISDEDYAATMVFLKRHKVYLDFRKYRALGGDRT